MGIDVASKSINKKNIDKLEAIWLSLGKRTIKAITVIKIIT
jgi:hypothetical protein